jgi:hypothetical protein
MGAVGFVLFKAHSVPDICNLKVMNLTRLKCIVFENGFFHEKCPIMSIRKVHERDLNV